MKIPNSFHRYSIIGPNQSAAPTEQLLEKLNELALRPGEIGMPEPTEWGWSGGEHIEDATFSFGHNVFNDCLMFALRIDTSKVPSDIKKSLTMQSEESAAKGNPSGFISKMQKATSRQEVTKQVDDMLRSGKYRRAKLVSVLWDFTTHTLYTPARPGSEDGHKLAELFERTFNLTLYPLTAGGLAIMSQQLRGDIRRLAELKPTRFVTGPAGEGQTADYPWVAKSANSSDFLGNEFLLWLWHHADAKTGIIQTADGDVTVMFDKSIDLDCAFGETGKDTLRGAGPTRMPEALKALQAGKMPRKAGLILDAHSQQYSFAIAAELLAVSGLTMPNIEKADTPRTYTEERITQLRDFSGVLDALYATFLKARTGGKWESTVAEIRKWIQTSK